MPLYEYYCSPCRNKFTLLRAMDRAEASGDCPACQGSARRAISTFARIGIEGEATWLTPDDAGSKGYGAGCCSGGCGCGH